MRVFGLTGGIGSGKSTVSRILRDEGIEVVDADLIAHEITAPGKSAHKEIVRTFGSGILLPGGGIDRKKLGGIVFADPGKRAALEAITHPAIASGIAEALGKLESEGCDIAVVEAALIYEARREGRFEKVIAVRCGRDLQVRRLMARDSITKEEAELRFSSQMDPEDKARASEIVIDNSGDLAATREQVLDLIAIMRQGIPPRA